MWAINIILWDELQLSGLSTYFYGDLQFCRQVSLHVKCTIIIVVHFFGGFNFPPDIYVTNKLEGHWICKCLNNELHDWLHTVDIDNVNEFVLSKSSSSGGYASQGLWPFISKNQYTTKSNANKWCITLRHFTLYVVHILINCSCSEWPWLKIAHTLRGV
jgi:hypothetical protein